MDARYACLPYATLTQPAVLEQPEHLAPGAVSLSDPATVVMTDFRRVPPLTINGNLTIADANTKMIACGVRLLFVTDAGERITGLITASDILGDKPVRHITQHGGDRNAILVRDIMVPHEHLDVLALSDVLHASVGAIVETVRLFGRQHLLVVAPAERAGETAIRGLFSSTQIERQLGQRIDLSTQPHRFAGAWSARLPQ